MTIYAVTGNQGLLSIDEITLAETLIGRLDQAFTDIALTSDGTLYGVTFSGLFRIDIQTLGAVHLADLSGPANGLTADPEGRLYIAYDNLDRVDVYDIAGDEVVAEVDLVPGARPAGDVVIRDNTLVASDVTPSLITVDMAADGDPAQAPHALAGLLGLATADEAILAFSGRSIYGLDPDTGVTTFLRDMHISSPVLGAASSPDTDLAGTTGNDMLTTLFANTRVDGGRGNDTLTGADGENTLYGGDGNDLILGGTGPADLRDLMAGGAGADWLDGGYGNDEAYGGDGNDTLLGGFGADRLAGQSGDDILSGGALSDQIFGGDGDDFLNGGFGFDRLNGGTGADRFFHLGLAGHGSDWVQDYGMLEGDTLVYGGAAGIGDFRINTGSTPNAGDAGIAEAFVIHQPSGQILWAIVDGAAQDHLLLHLEDGLHLLTF